MQPNLPDRKVKTLVLRDELQVYWRDLDVFAEVQTLDGEVARAVPGRHTLRFELHGKVYYRKLHTGVGWWEIVKNLLQLRLPIIGARNEWLALNRLAVLGVPSLMAVGFGEKYHNPAKQLSFIVTRELSGTAELDQYLREHRQRLSFNHKRELVQELARITRTIHADGINHRDLYLCHFLLDVQSMAEFQHNRGKPVLYLVDLHRAQMRVRVPRRWLVKDLASVYFSAMDLGITRADRLRFLITYFAQSLRKTMAEHGALLQQVEVRAQKLYQRELRLKARGLRE